MYYYATTGNFLFFHEGHQELISYILDTAKNLACLIPDKEHKILIGINSNEYVQKKYPNLENEILNFDIRMENMMNFIQSKLENNNLSMIKEIRIEEKKDEWIEKIIGLNAKVFYTVGEDYFPAISFPQSKVSSINIIKKSPSIRSKDFITGENNDRRIE